MMDIEDIGLWAIVAIAGLVTFVLFDSTYRDNRCGWACKIRYDADGECPWSLDRNVCLCGSGDDRQVICLDDDGCTGVGP